MTGESSSREFLDVPDLIERSIPRDAGRGFSYVTGAFFVVLIMSVVASSSSSRLLSQAFSIMGMLAVVVTMGVMASHAAKSAQQEQSEMQAAEELIQLRRWEQAAMMLERMLSRPARSPQSQVQMLLYLSAVLSRYHRYSDAIAVYDHLLQVDYEDEGLVHSLRLGRAMAMLHDDRLYDADRAINELRRDSAASNSAGLALVEIYRDVKTGHPREAIELFNKRVGQLKGQLGHRLSDAYALIARAYDLLDRKSEAQIAYECATLLAAESELHRRYAEAAALAGRYQASAIPSEVR